jgi:hypothetical protein
MQLALANFRVCMMRACFEVAASVMLLAMENAANLE